LALVFYSKMKQDDVVIQEIISNLGRLTEKLGISNTTGIVFGNLYFYGKKTQEQLRDDIGVGLSTVSQSLTVLEAFGFVKAEKQGRKKVYSDDKSNASSVVDNLLLFGVKPLIELVDNKKSNVTATQVKNKIGELSSLLNKFADKIRLFTK
jgi:DNA-binding transcriptional regulator GbsR (MarR family)